MSLNMLASVYTGINQTGSARVMGVGKSARYNRISGNHMIQLGIFSNLSSATVNKSPAVDSLLILFKPFSSFWPWPLTPDFDGQFMQITNQKGAGSEFKVNKFSSHGFNNAATNILMVTPNKGFEVRMSFRELFLQKWKQEIDSQLGGDASRKGDPTMTWTMFPQNVSHLDPNRKYLKIHQKLRIHVPWWPDYDASVTYHIYLYLDGNGKLKGHVARWAYWVESGVKAKKIAEKLEPKVKNGMSKVNERLNAELSQFSSIAFKDLYYLPGKQTTAKGTGVFLGNTAQDVTIVVQL